MGNRITLGDGTVLDIRPIEPDDAPRLAEMFDRLSPTTVYRRFFSPIARPPESTLRHLAGVDHRYREAVVALHEGDIVGVARYDARAGSASAEVAVTVEDRWQRRGLGRRLTNRLGRLAYGRGFAGFTAVVMGDNRPAIDLLRRLSPDAVVRWDDGAYTAYAPLRDGRSTTR